MNSGASLSAVTVGVALFAATNVDEIFLLSVFFADRHLSSRSVVLGQFLGIAALAAVSVAAALASHQRARCSQACTPRRTRDPSSRQR
jgi:cadmium resistance protein CadD (predicted permease)